MTPAKCPNCRLSLPQHWAGMNDPNGKCPYCGKVLTGNAPMAGAPSGPHATVTPSQPAAPAPRSAAAKTILWGAGAPFPGVNPKPSNEPSSAPVVIVGQASGQPSRPAAPQAPGPTQTHASGQIGGTAPAPAPYDSARSSEPPVGSARHGTLKPAQAIPAVATPGSGAIYVDMDADAALEPSAPTSSPSFTPDKVGGPAATVMFESATPARQEPVYSQTSYSGDVADDEADEDSSSRYRPTPSRSRNKTSGKKPSSGRRAVRTAEPDDDEAPSRGSGSKGKIIGIAAVVFAGLIGVAVVVLRPKDKPTEETSPAPAAKADPVAEPIFVPPTPVAEPAKPVTAPSARKAKGIEKPKVLAEPAPSHAEPKAEPRPTSGKPSDEDYRLANDAYQRGNRKLFQGDTAGAINEFSEALKLNPKDASSQRGLGLAYAQAGNNAEALRHLKLYLKTSPKANDRSIIEKRIDQLRGQ